MKHGSIQVGGLLVMGRRVEVIFFLASACVCFTTDIGL